MRSTLRVTAIAAICRSYFSLAQVSAVPGFSFLRSPNLRQCSTSSTASGSSNPAISKMDLRRIMVRYSVQRSSANNMNSASAGVGRMILLSLLSVIVCTRKSIRSCARSTTGLPFASRGTRAFSSKRMCRKPASKRQITTQTFLRSEVSLVERGDLRSPSSPLVWREAR